MDEIAVFHRVRVVFSDGSWGMLGYNAAVGGWHSTNAKEPWVSWFRSAEAALGAVAEATAVFAARGWAPTFLVLAPSEPSEPSEPPAPTIWERLRGAPTWGTNTW